jgi:two-component sensor histidine kinase/CheY-like chemotaxis protein
MPLTILYIDDDDIFVSLARKVLGRAGFEIIQATNQDAGFRLLDAGGIDVIVLDHFMADSTGIAFLETLSLTHHHQPVIYVSGSSDANIAIDALKAGASDYVIKSPSGNFWPLIVSAIDQALETATLRRAREQAEHEAIAARERAEVLLSEVNHRVANSLALAAATIRLQISASQDEAVKDALNETQGRITAIASMHRSLYTSDDVRQVEIDKYIHNIAQELAASIGWDESGPSVVCDLDPFTLSSDQAVSVGMIVTELLTNAMKYAYPDGMGGEIRIRLKRGSDGSAQLTVEDDGVGFDPASNPNGTGLGSKIVNSMASALGDSVTYLPREKGTAAQILIR